MKKQVKKIDRELQLNGKILIAIALNKMKLLVPFLIALLISTQANSFTSNSTGKTFDFAITSGKNTDISSSNFKTYSVIGDITSTVNSSNFKTEIGFLRTLPYLDNEPCQIGLECVGGFCCSNLCKSSACPSEAQPATSGGGASGAAGSISKVGGVGAAGVVIVTEYK